MNINIIVIQHIPELNHILILYTQNPNYIIGAAGAYAVGHLHYEWKKNSDIVFSIGGFILASLLFIIYCCDTLWILYILYIAFGTLYQIMSTITTYELILVFFFFFRNVQVKIFCM